MWLRGYDRAATEPETPDVAIEAGGPLPWSGQGNVITACGAALLGLVGRG